jgi:ATP synthase protein I
MRHPSPHGGHESEVEGMSKQTDLANAVLAYLLAGPAGFGLLGFGLDRWLGTVFLLPTGVMLGMAASMYVIWLRYGRS